MSIIAQTSDPVQKFLSLLGKVKSAGTNKYGKDQWMACCPAHDDRTPSLMVGYGEHDDLWLQCLAGCGIYAIAKAVGWSKEDLYPAKDGQHGPMVFGKQIIEPKPPAKPSKLFPTLEAYIQTIGQRHGGTWLYPEADGAQLAVVRKNGTETKKKIFLPFRRVPGGWLMEKPTGLTPLLYSDTFGDAKTIYWHEGEACADAGAAIGLTPSTTSAGGSGAIRKTDWSSVAGKNLVVFIDNDAPGEKAGRDIIEIASGLGPPARVKIIRLPDLPDGHDIVDYVAARDCQDNDTIRYGILEIIESTQWCEPTKPETSAIQTVGTPRGNQWPSPPASAAFHGPAGELVALIDPATEADPVAVLISFLIAFGNAIGRSAYFLADGARHYANLFAVLIGATSKGRKGTSWSRQAEILRDLDPEWATRITSGLSSGEGLIWFVRDPVVEKKSIKGKNGQPDHVEFVTTDSGVPDKRAMVLESEFASVLKVISREGNTLSPIVRQAWESGSLSSLVKNSQNRATGAHISIVGHITADELRERLDSTEVTNGLGNRFLWFAVKRSKELPDGGCIPKEAMDPIADKIAAAVDFSKTCGQMVRDEAAKAMWHKVYHDLSEAKPGLAGSLTSRSEAQVMRLAMIYALLDRSAVIQQVHLEAALALWKYCEASVTWCFGNKIGNTAADTIIDALESAGALGLSRTDISNLFGRNLSGEKLSAALTILKDRRLVKNVVISPAGGTGRPVEMWRKNVVDE